MNYEKELKECLNYYFLRTKLVDKQKPKRSYINNHALQRIRKQVKDSKFIDYLDQIISYKPCFHKGNEPCSTFNCHCFERGFCEKYCACNKELCKLRFKGCICESGNCLIMTCPCFAAGRECDGDLCKSNEMIKKIVVIMI